MSDNGQAAQAVFGEGYNCAQAVLAACGPQFGLPRETAIQVAQAFGGGVARTGHICGALTGALMLVGLACPAKDGADNAGKMKAYQLSRAIMDEFVRRNNSLTCRELTGCDLMTEEGQRRFKELDCHHKLCPKFVRDAAEIAQTILCPKENA